MNPYVIKTILSGHIPHNYEDLFRDKKIIDYLLVVSMPKNISFDWWNFQSDPSAPTGTGGPSSIVFFLRFFPQKKTYFLRFSARSAEFFLRFFEVIFEVFRFWSFERFFLRLFLRFSARSAENRQKQCF